MTAEIFTMDAFQRLRPAICMIALGLLLAGCGTTANRAPVENLSTNAAGSALMAQSSSSPVAQPGYYTVKPGDNLLRIAMAHGHTVQDLVQWNQITDPNRIEVGQTLRVAAPVLSTNPAPLAGNGVVVGTVAMPRINLDTTAAAAATAVMPKPAISSPAPATPVTSNVDNISWIWPADGELVARFDAVKNKGVDISGKAGDPVLAAADGRVVYAGAGLRGYGNLIIIKHNNTYLSAYAHNQSLLVKEDQTVTRGQKIAEMGSNEANRVMLHFEVRKQGKPVDPGQYLPPR